MSFSWTFGLKPSSQALQMNVTHSTSAFAGWDKRIYIIWIIRNTTFIFSTPTDSTDSFRVTLVCCSVNIIIYLLLFSWDFLNVLTWCYVRIAWFCLKSLFSILNQIFDNFNLIQIYDIWNLSLRLRTFRLALISKLFRRNNFIIVLNNRKWIIIIINFSDSQPNTTKFDYRILLKLNTMLQLIIFIITSLRLSIFLFNNIRMYSRTPLIFYNEPEFFFWLAENRS